MRFKKTTWGGLSAFLLACALLPAPYAGAAETVKAGDVYVTATRVERELQQVPMSLTVMTAEDVQKSGARTVGELLKDVPGIQMASDAPGLTRLHIRGEDAFRTVILVDGQRLTEHKSMSGTPMLIDASRIERVEVIKGPASVLYGSDAIGGVVNIITKKGGTKPIEGEAWLGFNGASRGFSEGMTVRGNIDGFKYALSGSHSDQGNLHTPDGEMPNTNFRQTDASAFLSYDFTDKFTIGAGLEYYKGAFDTFSPYSTEVSISDTRNITADGSMTVLVDKWARTKYYAFTEARDLSEYLSRVRFDIHYQKTEKDMSNHLRLEGPDYPSMFGGGKSYTQSMDNYANNIVRSKGLSLQTDWQFGANNYLVAGYELLHDKLDSTGRTVMGQSLYVPGWMIEGVRRGSETGNLTQNMAFITNKGYEGEQLTNAFYANMETSLPHDFTLTYGVRWTHVSTEMNRGDESTRGSMSMSVPQTDDSGKMTGWKNIPYMPLDSDDSDVKLGDTDESRPVFNVGLVWTGVEDLALRATWAQGYRVPSLSEKFMGSSMGSTTIFGNPDLDPETSNNFELGARYFSGPLSVDTALFFSLADNYISTRKLADSTYTYMNVSKATTYGAEAVFNYAINTNWGMFTPYMSATWMRREFDYGNGYKTYDSGTAELSGRYGVRYTKTLHPQCDFWADVYGRSQCGTEQRDATGSLSSEVGGFTTANVAFGFDFGQNKEFSLAAEVLNIFDKRYEYITSSMLEPGVHANVKLTYKF